MSWGCKQKPNGCGWAWWQQYQGSDRTLWCGVPAQQVVDLSLPPSTAPQTCPDGAQTDMTRKEQR